MNTNQMTFINAVAAGREEVVYNVPVDEIELGPRGGIKFEDGQWFVLSSEYTDETMTEVSEHWIPTSQKHVQGVVKANWDRYKVFAAQPFFGGVN